MDVLTGTPTDIKARLAGIPVTWESLRDGQELPAERINGIPVRRVKLPGGASWRRERIFAGALRRHCLTADRVPDVVQLLSLSLTRASVLPALRRRRIATVFTGTMVATLSSNPVRRFAQRWRRRAPLQLVDRVVASTQTMRRYFEELGVTTPIHVIPNGVDLRRFRPPRSRDERRRLRQSLGVDPDVPVLLFVGSVIRRKGVDLLLSAFARVAAENPDARLYVLGPRRDLEDPAHRAFADEIQHLICTTGAADRIRFLGVVDNVEEYLRVADLLVFPSRREGMGNVVLEAMASGLPVVLTPYLGLPEELGVPGEHYLLVDPHPTALGKTINRLLADPAQRQALGGAAKEWVERQLDLERVLNSYAELYEDVQCGSRVAGKGRSPP